MGEVQRGRLLLNDDDYAGLNWSVEQCNNGGPPDYAVRLDVMGTLNQETNLLNGHVHNTNYMGNPTPEGAAFNKAKIIGKIDLLMEELARFRREVGKIRIVIPMGGGEEEGDNDEGEDD